LKKKSKIIIFITAAFLVLFYFYINPYQFGYLPKCPLYSSTGIYCPGCGSQRAIHELLHLNFLGFIRQNTLLLLLILLLIYHGVVILANSYFNKTWKSLLNHKKTPYFLLVIAILFWILRNLPFKPFIWLAPY